MKQLLFLPFLILSLDALTLDKQENVDAFIISPQGTGSALATLTASSGASIRCEFQYSTSISKKEKKSEVQSNNDTPESIMEKLKGKCVQTRLGYFSYEVCVGGQAHQETGDGRILLGAYSTTSGVVQYYKNGERCATGGRSFSRSMELSFVCGSGSLSIVSVQEPSTCNYKMILETKHVCGNPAFTQHYETPAIVTDDERWVLELDEAMDGSLVCTAHHTNMPSAVVFREYSLKVDCEDCKVEELHAWAGRLDLVQSEQVEGTSVPGLRLKEDAEVHRMDAVHVVVN